MNITKFYYSKEINCLYFLENDFLMAIELNSNGTYNTEDSFQVEEFNEMLRDESILDNDHITLGYIWSEARKALKR